MKEKFYIFIDVDGVFYDWFWLKKEIHKGHIKKGGLITSLKPESIEAINHLITTLNNNYEVEVVVSSTWRDELNIIENILHKNGFIYDKKMSATPKEDPCKRGLEIFDFLKDKKDKNNYCIIDDENFDFDEYFSSKRIIRTNLYDHALNMEDIQQFLTDLNESSDNLENE